ncbi:hypothetical protein COY03_00875 [bacterium CG_4_10_14_0_2_um_filter_48_144]|nr:MAG: hypothetical protein COY03_00875 [bacterium CG_4_10_14_0_2_um_filter_48_144]
MALLLSHFTTRGDTMGFRIQESSTNRIARMFASVLSEIKEIRWHKAIKAPNAHVVTLETPSETLQKQLLAQLAHFASQDAEALCQALIILLKLPNESRIYRWERFFDKTAYGMQIGYASDARCHHFIGG